MTSIEPWMVDHLDDFVDRLYRAGPRPPNYLCGALRKPEMKILARLFLKIRPPRSLEWGLGTGISAAVFSEARRLLGLKDRHIALDPLQQEMCGGWGLRCLEEFDMLDLVAFSPITSEQYLADARRCGSKFDFILVDGDHDVGHTMMDARMATHVLSNNGVICFHDSFFASTASAITYLVKERGFEMIPLAGEPTRRRLLRAAKHSPRMGWRFSCTVAPFVHYSIAALCKLS